MRVKTLTLLAIALLIFLSTVANAAKVTISPTTIYETTTVWKVLDLDNYQGSSLITNIAVDSPNLEITAAKEYLGWTTSFDADSAEWKDGIIATNVKSAFFEFQVTAPNVTQNSTVTITANVETSSTPFNISILNDPTPPNISEVEPDGYARANNPSQIIDVLVTDPETNISSVTYAYSDCSGNETAVELSQTGDVYSGTADFSAFDEGEKACYTITATNKPGETSNKNGELKFDGTPPSVSIISPKDYAIENAEFKFNATDNIAANLSCMLELNSTELGAVTAESGEITSVTHNLSSLEQGSYDWSVTCTDGVGLTATDSQSIILDTQPPAIEFKSEPYILRTQPTAFKVKITDLIGVSGVNISFEGNPVNLSQNGDVYSGTISSGDLGTKNLTIKASDAAGHAGTHTETITVVPGHAITLNLSSNKVKPGKRITASGTLIPDGNTTGNSVVIKTPDEEISVNLTDNSYSATFSAPDSDGIYTIIAEYDDAGYTYTAKAKLTVGSPIQTSGEDDYSSGYESSWSGGESYVKPDDVPEDTGEDTNSVEPDEPQSQPEPEPEKYEPLPAEEPRDALTPKATGVFSLGKAVKWTAILLAIALLGGLGTWAYYKRPKKPEGMSWNGYFERTNGP